MLQHQLILLHNAINGIHQLRYKKRQHNALHICSYNMFFMFYSRAHVFVCIQYMCCMWMRVCVCV